MLVIFEMLIIVLTFKIYSKKTFDETCELLGASV